MINVSLEHDDVLNMICGSPIPFGGMPGELAQYTPFSGNQWSENWSWDREKLSKLNLQDLMQLYIKSKACIK